MKWLREHGFVFYPVFVFFTYFAVEKVCGLPAVKRLTQGDATYLFFEYKQELLRELVAVSRDHAVTALDTGTDPGRDIDPAEPGFPPAVVPKTLLVLGSSRLLYFDYERFDRNFPEWEMFNFSAPVTAPAYYLYVLERALEAGAKPDYILLETDPFQFNASSDAFRRSNVGYSFDLRFMLKYFLHFERDDVSYFLGRTFFAGYHYPPDLRNVRKRLGNPSDPVMLMLPLLEQYQRTYRGAGKNVIPRENWFERDYSILELSSQKALRWIYGNYRLAENQFYFLERIIELAKAHNIKVTLVRPPVSRPMTEMLAENPKIAAGIEKWEGRMNEIVRQHGVTFVDLERRPDYACNAFVDASHMAMDCYHPMIVLLMREYYEKH